MTESLGDQIIARRQLHQEIADIAMELAKDWAKSYTDNIRDAVISYVDNQITIAKTYVDNQITASQAQSKTYVDNQITTSQAQSKTYVDNKTAALGTRIDNLIAHNGLTP